MQKLCFLPFFEELPAIGSQGLVIRIFYQKFIFSFMPPSSFIRTLLHRFRGWKLKLNFFHCSAPQFWLLLFSSVRFFCFLEQASFRQVFIVLHWLILFLFSDFLKFLSLRPYTLYLFKFPQLPSIDAFHAFLELNWVPIIVFSP